MTNNSTSYLVKYLYDYNRIDSIINLYNDCCRINNLDIIIAIESSLNNFYNYDANFFTDYMLENIDEVLDNAIRTNNINIVEHIIRNYPDSEYEFSSYANPLMLSLANSNYEMFKILYEFAKKYVDLNATTINNTIILEKLLEIGDNDILKYFMRDNYLNNIVTLYDSYDCENLKLISNNVDYDNVSDDDFLVIMKIFIDNSDLDFIKYFLKYKCNDNIIRKMYDYSVEIYGDTTISNLLLNCIIFRDNDDIFIQKIKLGNPDIIINDIDQIEFNTLLNAYKYSISHNHNDIVELLQEKICQIEKKCKKLYEIIFSE